MLEQFVEEGPRGPTEGRTETTTVTRAPLLCHLRNSLYGMSRLLVNSVFSPVSTVASNQWQPSECLVITALDQSRGSCGMRRVTYSSRSRSNHTEENYQDSHFNILTATLVTRLGFSLSSPSASPITTWPKQPSPSGFPRTSL